MMTKYAWTLFPKEIRAPENHMRCRREIVLRIFSYLLLLSKI